MASFRQSVRLFSTAKAPLSSKINIQKPAMPWTERRILNAVTVPILPPDLRLPPQKCWEEKKEFDNAKRSELQQAYETFRTKETFKMFSENKMVAICHILPMTSRDFFNVRIKVHNAGMLLKFANNRWARDAVQGSRYQHLEPFLISDNVYIISEEAKLSQLMAVLKKTPELQLLGGLVEDRIMSKAAMQDAAKLPLLDIMRGELLTILSASAAKTSRLLGKHQTELSANLAQLVKQGGASGGGAVTQGGDAGGSSGATEGQGKGES